MARSLHGENHHPVCETMKGTMAANSSDMKQTTRDPELSQRREGVRGARPSSASSIESASSDFPPQPAGVRGVPAASGDLVSHGGPSADFRMYSRYTAASRYASMREAQNAEPARVAGEPRHDTMAREAVSEAPAPAASSAAAPARASMPAFLQPEMMRRRMEGAAEDVEKAEAGRVEGGAPRSGEAPASPMAPEDVAMARREVPSRPETRHQQVAANPLVNRIRREESEARAEREAAEREAQMRARAEEQARAFQQAPSQAVGERPSGARLDQETSAYATKGMRREPVDDEAPGGAHGVGTLPFVIFCVVALIALVIWFVVCRRMAMGSIMAYPALFRGGIAVLIASLAAGVIVAIIAAYRAVASRRLSPGDAYALGFGKSAVVTLVVIVAWTAMMLALA